LAGLQATSITVINSTAYSEQVELDTSSSSSAAAAAIDTSANYGTDYISNKHNTPALSNSLII